MSNATKGIIGTLAVVLAALALAPGAAALATRTPTELGQRVPKWGESGGTTNGSPDAPGAAALATRTPTELGQRVPTWGESGGTTSGFDWGDAAVGAAMMVGLGVVGFGGLVLVNRRRQMEHGSDSRLASA